MFRSSTSIEVNSPTADEAPIGLSASVGGSPSPASPRSPNSTTVVPNSLKPVTSSLMTTTTLTSGTTVTIEKQRSREEVVFDDELNMAENGSATVGAADGSAKSNLPSNQVESVDKNGRCDDVDPRPSADDTSVPSKSAEPKPKSRRQQSSSSNTSSSPVHVQNGLNKEAEEVSATVSPTSFTHDPTTAPDFVTSVAAPTTSTSSSFAEETSSDFTWAPTSFCAERHSPATEYIATSSGHVIAGTPSETVAQGTSWRPSQFPVSAGQNVEDVTTQRRRNFNGVRLDPASFVRREPESAKNEENGVSYPAPPSAFLNSSSPPTRDPPPLVPPKTLAVRPALVTSGGAIEHHYSNTDNYRFTDSVSTATSHFTPQTYGHDRPIANVNGNLEVTRTPDTSLPVFTRVNPLGSHLPQSQNPTVTLLQKAREGQIPQRGAVYIDHKMNSKENRHVAESRERGHPTGNWWDGQFALKSYDVYDDHNVLNLKPIKYEGVGPVVKGVPISLCTGVKDENKGEWYKKMYKSLHRANDPDGRYPYTSQGGYMSEPEAQRDVERFYEKYTTLDRRKTHDDYQGTQERRTGKDKSKGHSLWIPPSARYSSDIYKNQPKRIEDYEPGRSSIAEMEAKMNASRNNIEPSSSTDQNSHPRMFKDGYESDSTLIYRKRDRPIESLSPSEQKTFYREFQKGGDIPYAGFRRPGPDRASAKPTADPSESRLRPRSVDTFDRRPGQVSQLRHRFEEKDRTSDWTSSWRRTRGGTRPITYHEGRRTSSSSPSTDHHNRHNHATSRKKSPANQIWVLLGHSKSSPNLVVDLDSTEDVDRLLRYGSSPDCLDSLSDSSYSPGLGWTSGFSIHDRNNNDGRTVRMPDISLFSPRQYPSETTGFRKVVSRSVDDLWKPSPSVQSNWPEYLKKNASSITGAVQDNIQRFENGTGFNGRRCRRPDIDSSYTYAPLITTTPLPSPKMIRRSLTTDIVRDQSPEWHGGGGGRTYRHSPRPLPPPPPPPPLLERRRQLPTTPRRRPNSDVDNNKIAAHLQSSVAATNMELDNLEFGYPPPKVPLIDPADPERRYNESQVNIHYRSPIRNLEKGYMSEDEIRRRQEQAMRQFYEEERKKKIMQEWADAESRRHNDNFVPSQKSPIPLNRYESIFDEQHQSHARIRTSEPKMAARALYGFTAQSAKELSFSKGDIIFIHRNVDKNWYEGEHHGLIGLLPVNHVEIIPYDSIRPTMKKPVEGQARVKYNFRAQTPMELSLVKGENVILTRRIDRNWYEGRIGNLKGIFPSNYVQVLVEPGTDFQGSRGSSALKPVSSPISHSLMINGTAVARSNSSHDVPSNQYNDRLKAYSSIPYATVRQYAPARPAAPTSYQDNKYPLDQTLHIQTQTDPIPYRAIYAYKPQNDDELELKESDTVYVMEKCDDGWYVGSSQRTGLFGTFPGNYVERI